MSLYDQLIWGSFLIKSCHLLKLSYFVLSVWQLLLYFSVEKYGIYFCCLLSLRSYKERQVCVYIYIHTWLFMCTVSHTQINVVGKPLPLFPIINDALAHPRLQPHWTFGPPCPNLFPCIKKLQTQPNKTPSSITTKPGDTWGTKQLQTEIIYICPLRGPFLTGPFSPSVVPLPMHRASKVSSCSPTHETVFSGRSGKGMVMMGRPGTGNCDGFDENVVPRKLRTSFVQLWGRVGCLPPLSLSACGFFLLSH